MAHRTSPTRPNPSPDHIELAKSRIRDILSQRIVATTRTFDHLISDTGDPRLEPHILGRARKILVRDSELETKILRANDPPWFYLPDARPADVDSHLATLAPLLQEISRQAVTGRRGQCLELAIFRALRAQPDAQYLGRFLEFDPTAPTRPKKLYSKEEPPSHIGNRAISAKRPLDFLYQHPAAGFAGIEAKNVREWLYPGGEEVKALLYKCVSLDCVPVLVARRFPRSTFEILGLCGVVLHQTLNQLYHFADKDLADRAMRQDSLDFDDIRVGDKPDARLLRFIGTTLPEVLPCARARFDKFKDLLACYASREMQYFEFSGRVRLRAAGKEEADWEDADQGNPDDNYY